MVFGTVLVCSLCIYMMATVKAEFSLGMNTTPGFNQNITNSSDLVLYFDYVFGVSGIICAPIVLTLLLLVVYVYKA